MFKVSIILHSITLLYGSYLEAESNYKKPKLERNNVVNKGLWVRNQDKRPSSGAFIFRANSLDADALVQTSNDIFGENGPFISSYLDRNKRSTSNKEKERLRKSRSKKCGDGSKCLENDVLLQSNLLKQIKPSFFNDYPYAFALTDNQGGADVSDPVKSTVDATRTTATGNQGRNKIPTPKVEGIPMAKLNNGSEFNKTSNSKRSMSDFYEFRDVKKVEITETLNNTQDETKHDRSVFEDDSDVIWHQAAPVKTYKVLPQNRNVKNRPISEKGLIKVLSMLTKSFKKIIKQHNEMKSIHKQMLALNEEFEKNIDNVNSKFIDFDIKHEEIIKIGKEIKNIEEKLKSKEQHDNQQEQTLVKKMLEFENQQKKFLLQQQQFYNVQKLMLEENEKINLKQNLIAKTQNEISQKQNNFARVLKKTQQLYANIKPQGSLPVSIAKQKHKEHLKVPQTTPATTTTNSIKINLLSIPQASPMQNYDKLLLNEKNYKNIDDLIYKYYFNNTFIDDIMKNKILASFASDKRAINTKNKRDELKNKKTTILLPVENIVAKELMNQKLQRARRWIRHQRKNIRRRHRNATSTVPTTAKTDVKTEMTKTLDPFIIMATSFCKEIGQNASSQILSWCIEKALRRLKIMTTKLESQTAPTEATIKTKSEVVNINSVFAPKSDDIKPVVTKTAIEVTTNNIPKTLATKGPEVAMYFPDNDELESNLKQYELIQDNEGTVYFDGSLHSSDIAKIGKIDGIDSEGFSDIMPGLDSNSRVEVNPMAFDIQAQRRANVRRMNERILKMKMI